MSIWKTPIDINSLNQRSKNTMVEYLDIIFTDFNDQFMYAKMPITDKVRQPIGIMNGGASCVLAESLGSTAANYAVDIAKQYCVGLDINTNHIRPISKGFAYAKTYPYHIGRTTHVWCIEITNDMQRLVSISRLTMAVKNR